MEEPLLSSPANPAQAADRCRFVDVDEDDERIFVYYEPTEMIQYINGVPRSIPMTRLSYEAALANLAASTKPHLHFDSVYTPDHMEHIEKILRTCTHFKDVNFVNPPSPVNQQIYNLVKNKSIEKENNTIRVHFTRELDDNESAILIDVNSNGYNIFCHILDPECTVYAQFLDYLKAVANKNNFVNITLDGVHFRDLFGKLGWQYEGVMDENLSNGVDTTIRVMDDNNIYSLEYWDQVCRRLDEEDNRKSEEIEMESRANLWYQMIQ